MRDTTPKDRGSWNLFPHPEAVVVGGRGSSRIFEDSGDGCQGVIFAWSLLQLVVMSEDRRGAQGPGTVSPIISAGISSPVKWILRDEVSIIRDKSEVG